MNRRKFIVGLLSAVTAFCGFKFVNKKILSNDPWLRHVEIHLVEHCNLNCKYCSHFSSIAKKEFYNLNEFKKDMARLAKVTNKKIKNIQLLGGEPLLHPNINEMMKFVRRKFPYTPR